MINLLTVVFSVKKPFYVRYFCFFHSYIIASFIICYCCFCHKHIGGVMIILHTMLWRSGIIISICSLCIIMYNLNVICQERGCTRVAHVLPNYFVQNNAVPVSGKALTKAFLSICLVLRSGQRVSNISLSYLGHEKYQVTCKAAK